MTPKDKAEELIGKFMFAQFEAGDIIKNPPLAKQCALICIDEIINAFENMILSHKKDEEYWQEVKSEIEKI